MIAIDFELLRPIGLTPYIAQQLLMLAVHPETEAHPESFAARVTAIHRNWIAVHNGKNELHTRTLPHADVEKLAVGDWVIATPGANNEYWICERMEPVTKITRRNHDASRQLLVSNIDTALLVMGLDNDFNLRRMERYLTLVQTAQVSPVIVLTKQDVVEDAEEKFAQIKARLPAHLPIYAVNALERNSLLTLEPWLNTGQTLVLLGSSGAGKSTLTNQLTNSEQQTRDVRKGDSRGRHTTTSRSLHLCTNGACIIDTPGLRSWSPDADKDSLAIAFDDIASLALDCKFRNCQHNDEPGCAVRGVIDNDRLQNYQKLLREIKRSQQTTLEQIEERAKWKVLQKAAEVRGREKRKEY